MSYSQPSSPRLRFLNRTAFSPLASGVAVQVAGGEKVGSLAGFVVDSESLSASYAVVDPDTGANDYYFVPVGRTELEPDGRKMTIDIPPDRVAELPHGERGTTSAFTDDHDTRFRQHARKVFGEDDQANYREPGYWPATREAYERAQPGSVIGIETAGKRTHLGETKADETERRDESLEEAAQS